MIAIYSEKITPRLTYVLDQVFVHFLNIEYSYCDKNSLSEANHYSINYSFEKNLGADLYIRPNALLFNNTIEKINVEHSSRNELLKLFPDNESDIGFDVFSSIFYLLSRYEEYLPGQRDEHDRFSSIHSLMYKLNILELPMVDIWVEELRKKINNKFLNIKPVSYSVINTIDIDNAYAFKGKSTLRTTGAFLKDVLNGKLKQFNYRRKVIAGKLTDPFDNYDYVRDISQTYNVRTIFFNLCGKLSNRDRNLDVNSLAYKKLLAELNEWSELGLHPSYCGNTDFKLWKEEKNKLEKISGKRIEKSRQHFLKLKLPETYEQLIKLGIKEDYSMGYADAIGFRAGTGRKFQFYDLSKEKTTVLWLQPLCAMDGTMKDYMKFDVETSLQKIRKMKAILKECGSTFAAVWHNETLGENYGWEGWRKVFEEQFK